MCKIIISIKPKHVKNILSGVKKFEYRTKIPRKNIKSIVIYSTSPEQKIVGEAKVKNILAKSPDELWIKTRKHSGITKEFFDLYFKDKEIAYAYELYDIMIYNEPKSLQNFGILKAPQSFIYLDK